MIGRTCIRRRMISCEPWRRVTRSPPPTLARRETTEYRTAGSGAVHIQLVAEAEGIAVLNVADEVGPESAKVDDVPTGQTLP
ncbi:MAG: hypothetical protein AAF681_09995 [Pseudomonadota bacterium]